MAFEQAQNVLRLAFRHLVVFRIRIQIHAVGNAQALALGHVVKPGLVVLVSVVAAVTAANDGEIDAAVLHRLPVDGMVVLADVDALAHGIGDDAAAFVQKAVVAARPSVGDVERGSRQLRLAAARRNQIGGVKQLACAVTPAVLGARGVGSAVLRVREGGQRRKRNAGRNQRRRRTIRHFSHKETSSVRDAPTAWAGALRSFPQSLSNSPGQTAIPATSGRAEARGMM